MEWVDVKQELPPDGAYVQIVLCGTTVFVGRLGTYAKGARKWQMGTDSKPIMGVTHWKPLDAPPAAIRESKESK